METNEKNQMEGNIDLSCFDLGEERKTGALSVTCDLMENEVYHFWNLDDLENSPITDWDNWSIQDGNPKNDVD